MTTLFGNPRLMHLALLGACIALLGLPTSPALAVVPSSCSTDIDGNGSADALTDGRLLVRSLLGLDGTALTGDDAVGPGATRQDAASIQAFLAQPDCLAMTDVDGNGIHEALTDGVLFLRWLLVFDKTQLVTGALGGGAQRETGEAVDAHLAGFTPALPPTPEEAARFLTQATFGPTLADIDHLITLGGYQAWLDEQFALPFAAQLPEVIDLTTRMCFAPGPDDEVLDTWFSPGRHSVWWDHVVRGQDQLRQRMAFALSEILVVSEREPALSDAQFGLADYWDTLMEHALGNYRDLLEDVTLHPVMGLYLSMMRNQRADPERNIRPDENYAREVKQLFTIGVHKLNPDGSLQLDDQDQPIPTYDQDDITQFARVFTGWNFANLEWYEWIGRGDTMQPMFPWDWYHDRDEKILLNGLVLPPDQYAEHDLDAALDNLFQHPNVGPFIARQLIQRLVTSNPSPAYVARVAAAFDDNGQGVRGDLRAVANAILLDDEARNGPVNQPEDFGKLREPLLRFSHFWRAFNAQPIALSGRFWDHDRGCEDENGEPTLVYEYDYYRVWWGLYDFSSFIGQGILGAPSVFNFFQPDYSPPGVLRDQELLGPEFQLATENYLVNTANALNSQIQEDGLQGGWHWVTLDLTPEAALADDPAQLLDHLDLLLLNGTMSPQLRQILLDHLNNSEFHDGNRGRLDKARDAAMLIANSPEYLIQR